MTMKRISLLLVGVVVAVMLSMGTALAHSKNNHKLCHVKRGHDITKTGLSHNEWRKELNRHHRDYAGKCEGGGGGANIGKLAAGPF